MSGTELTGDACSVGDCRKPLSLQASAQLGEETTGIFMYTCAWHVFTTQATCLAGLNLVCALPDTAHPCQGVF